MRIFTNFLFFFLLQLCFVSHNALKLKASAESSQDVVLSRQRRSGNQLRKNGKNVCVFRETRTIYENVQTTVTETFEKEVCCKDFIRCWKKCKRTGVITKTVTKTISRLKDYEVYHCCKGWSVIDSTHDDCQKPVCNPYCRNNGLCTGPNYCSCKSGFTGRFCQLDVDECTLGEPCEQSCINLPGTYQCLCNKGYRQGDPESKSCADINECLLTPCKCASGGAECNAQCVNTVGSYRCTCGGNFRLARNNLCTDENECLENPDICPHACVNTNGGHQCRCFQGFDYDPAKQQCVAKNFCDGYQSGCEHGCQPVFGGFVCTCKSGYYLHSDRYRCIDINECAAGMNPCDPQTSTCRNTPGGYHCICKGGFFKSGIICDDRDECKEKTALCEQKCVNNFGSYTCGCEKGFTLNADGITCDDIDECAAGKTYCSQRCVNSIGSFACACNPGYTLDVDKKTCHANPCKEMIDPFFGKVTCNGHVVGKKCTFTCDTGYQLSGPHERTCETSGKWSGRESKCLPKNCAAPTPPSNGKVTLPCELSYGATCPITCLEGYILRGKEFMKCDIVYGRLKWDIRNIKCEEILVCKPNPCLNSGVCSIVTDTEYNCNCTSTGHSGKNCEKLIVEVPRMPKLPANTTSSALSFSSKPLRSVKINIYPEHPDIVFSSSSVELTKFQNNKKVTLRSSITGLRWVAYEITSSEPTEHVPDGLMFFHKTGSLPEISGNSLLGLAKDCYNVIVKPKSCSNIGFRFSSTAWWSSRSGGLVSTDGTVFVDINAITFPVALPKIRTTDLFYDFKHAAEIGISQQPKNSTCRESHLSNGQLQYSVLNDLFVKDFIKQYNQLTPAWFTLSVEGSLRYIHADNIRTYIWTGARVKQEVACAGAAIDEESFFLVYLHHEKLSLKVYEKNIIMQTGGKFCFLIDMCKAEPHLVIPPDNHGHLETVFSFAELQSLGWTINVKSVGFRKSSSRDKRKCRNPTELQVAFGSARIEYKHKSYVRGGAQGNLFMQLVNKNGKQEISSLNQCFDGKSRFDTPAWYTADTKQKRYTKQAPAHNVVKSRTSRPKPKQDVFTIIQGKNSVFQMKTGLRPVLKKAGDQLHLNFMYKETKAKSTGTGDNNFEKITALQMIQIPLMDIESAMMSIFVTTEPLFTKLSKFQQFGADWNSEIFNDVNEMMIKVGDSNFVLSKIRTHYYKTGPAVIELTELIASLKADKLNSIDPSSITTMESALSSLKIILADLKKFAVIKKATKDFTYLTLNFAASMCMFRPCMESTNVTLYPAKYDLKLAGLCHDLSKGPYDMWQTEVIVNEHKTMGNFFNFRLHDKMFICLSKDGVKAAKIQSGIKVLGNEIRDEFILEYKRIVIPKKAIRLFGKYDFIVNSTVNLELNNWDMASVRSYGYANVGSSSLIGKLQTKLDTFATEEYYKSRKRLHIAQNTIKEMTGKIHFYTNKIKQDQKVVGDMKTDLADKKSKHKWAVENFKAFETTYTRNRVQMIAIENAVKNRCTIKSCPFTCAKIPKCTVCQKPWMVNKTVPLCKVTLEDRRYGYLKSQQDVCSHTVQDRTLKYTGTCEQPAPEPGYAQNVIDRLNGKIKKNESLTLEDAYLLESINPKAGKKLIDQIEKKMFFDSFPRRLQNVLLTEEEFNKLESYTNKTFADKIRKRMKTIKNAKIMNRIMVKLNMSEPLTEEDYQSLRMIDPQLEKNVRKSQAIAEITKKIQLTGNVTEEDLEKLRKIAPEYSKNLTALIEKQEYEKKVLAHIQKRMANGSLSPDDIKKLEAINPTAAEKLKAALKEQLEQKVKEMESKLNTVKGALDHGLNNSEFKNLQDQLNTLSGSLKPYDRDTLKKLQEKILANNETSGSIFEEVFERLDLGYDIKNITGNSADIQRVLQHFFAVLPKFDIPSILQRSAVGVLKGLQNVQEWFQMAAKIVAQACTRCGSACNKDNSLKQLLNTLNQHIKSFDSKICKPTWTDGVKIDSVKEICAILSKVQSFVNGVQAVNTTQCDKIATTVITPLKQIVGKWKDARKAMEALSSDQWKKHPKTVAMFKEYNDFATKLRSAFSAELGSVKISLLTEAEVIAEVEASLKDDNSTVSMSQFEVLNAILTNVVSGIENLPNLVKQNRQTTVSVSTNEASGIVGEFKKLIERVLPSLNQLCIDKKPDSNPKFRAMPILITNSEAQLKLFLNSKTLPDLLKYAQRFNQFAKNMIIFMNEVKASQLV